MRWPILLLMPLVVAGLVPAQNGRFIERTQEPTGNWSAQRFDGQPQADLRVNALLLLAFVGDGSNSRKGPSRAVVKRGVRWLIAQQDDEGRFALRADPGWLLDHAMATYALAEDLRLAQWTRLREPLYKAARALETRVRRDRPDVGAEVRLWSWMVARSLTSRAAIVATKHPAAAARIRAASADLLQALSQLKPVVPKNDRERAAAALLAVGRAPDGKEIEIPELPADLLLDPMATLYVTVARFHLGGEPWKKLQKRLKAVVKTMREDGAAETIGSWDPVGPFGEENGRLGTTAVAILLVEHYYRYCELQFVHAIR